MQLAGDPGALLRDGVLGPAPAELTLQLGPPRLGVRALHHGTADGSSNPGREPGRRGPTRSRRRAGPPVVGQAARASRPRERADSRPVRGPASSRGRRRCLHGDDQHERGAERLLDARSSARRTRRASPTPDPRPRRGVTDAQNRVADAAQLEHDGEGAGPGPRHVANQLLADRAQGWCGSERDRRVCAPSRAEPSGPRISGSASRSSWTSLLSYNSAEERRPSG